MTRTTTFILLLCLLAPAASSAQVIQKISATEGDFTGTLADFDRFGAAIANLGDLDGDGVTDIAVGAPRDKDGGDERGAVWILFLNRDGTVKDHWKISHTHGGATPDLENVDHFGAAIANLGDLDDDPETVTTLAVGAPSTLEREGRGTGRGAVWVLFLQRNGTVKTLHKLDDGEDILQGRLAPHDLFGASVADLGDLDDDPATMTTLVVGAPRDNGLGVDRGAVWLLYLRQDGTARKVQKIAEDHVPGGLLDGDSFGASVVSLGTREDDLVLAVGGGAEAPEDRTSPRVVVLDRAGQIKSHLLLSPLDDQIFSPNAGFSSLFGKALASLGDLDGNGFAELAVGDGNGAAAYPNKVALLFLNEDGTVKTHRVIRPADDVAVSRNGYGLGLAGLGDLNGDGVPDLAIGAPVDNDGGREQGAVWIYSLGPQLVPGLSALPVEPQQPALGQDLGIAARITDLSGTGLTSTRLNFRRAGDPVFFNVPLQEQGAASYAFTIPASLLNTGSVEYFITATNGLGGSSRLPASGFFSQPIYLPDGLETPLTHGNETTAYRLVSLPLDLDEPGAVSVLEDDLGPYDKTKWRFFVHTGGAQFTEPDLRSVLMRPGRAFWLLVKDPGLRLTTGPGTSVATDVPFRIPLLRGWNLIGSPFNHPLPLSQLRTASGQALDVRRYDGAWQSADSVLVPFEGYILLNAQPEVDTLLIDPDVSASSLAQQTASKGAVVSWSIQIKAQQGQARDIDNVAAVASAASPGWDGLDRPEPPVVGDYVSVSFPHPEWQRNTARYSTDARPAPVAGERWAFEVRTRRPGRVVLRFEGLETVPPAYEVWLVDEGLQTRQDLRLQPVYAVAGAGEGVAKRLALVVGRRVFVEEAMAETAPVHPELLANYPNPFRVVTTIRYGLAEAGAVRLVVYDVLGRQVARLIQGEQSAGYHAVVWDGRSDAGVPVGSSLYVVRMQAGAFTQARKMLLVR